LFLIYQTNKNNNKKNKKHQECFTYNKRLIVHKTPFPLLIYKYTNPKGSKYANLYQMIIKKLKLPLSMKIIQFYIIEVS